MLTHKGSFHKARTGILGPIEISVKSPVGFSEVKISVMVLIQLLPLNTTVSRLFLQKVNVKCVYFFFEQRNFFANVNIRVPLNFHRQSRKSVSSHVCVSHILTSIQREWLSTAWKLGYFPYSCTWPGGGIHG